jgi:hypothetical protein
MQVQTVRILWVFTGVALGMWSVWGLVTERTSALDWLIVLAFAIVAGAGGYLFGRTRLLGRVLVSIASLVSLLYALVWLFLGGAEDAFGYVVVLVPLVCLSIYALVVASTNANAV